MPQDLAAARGTPRDVSFCQSVVRDERVFEVNDAANDARVPQHLVQEYGIRAYLGFPIRVGETVVGSLCVLDTKARRFSDEERHSLEQLVPSVDERMEAMTAGRRQLRLALTDKATAPALADLRESLKPVNSIVNAGLNATAAIRSFIRLYSSVLEDGSTSPEVLRRSFVAAAEATEAIEDGLHNIMMAEGDCEDCLVALEHLTTPSPSTRLSEALLAAQDLARQLTRPVGGALVHDFAFDPLIYTPRPLAVGLLAASLMNVAARLASLGSSSGITIRLLDHGGTAEIRMFAEGLSDDIANEVASELSGQIGNDPSVLIEASGSAVLLKFSVVESGKSG